MSWVILYLLSTVLSAYRFHQTRAAKKSWQMFVVVVPFLNLLVVVLEWDGIDGPSKQYTKWMIETQIKQERMRKKEFKTIEEEAKCYEEILEGILFWRASYWNPKSSAFKSRYGYPWHDWIEFQTDAVIHPEMLRGKMPFQSLKIKDDALMGDKTWLVKSKEVYDFFAESDIDREGGEIIRPVLEKLKTGADINLIKKLRDERLNLIQCYDKLHWTISKQGYFFNIDEKELLSEIKSFLGEVDSGQKTK